MTSLPPRRAEIHNRHAGKGWLRGLIRPVPVACASSESNLDPPSGLGNRNGILHAT